MKDDACFVAVVTDAELPPSLKERMVPRAGRLLAYPTVEELVEGGDLQGMRVLVIWTQAVPKGRLLPVLARLNLERPWVQKIAMLEAQPPLVMAEYLTHCGVEVIWTGSEEERIERVKVLVNRSEERTRWLGAA